MWIVLIAVVLIVVVVATVGLLRRPRASDLSSVRKYHSALGTIEHLAERTGQGTGTPARPPAGTGRPEEGGRTGRAVPPVPVRGNGEFPDPEAPIVFDDARPPDRYAREHPPQGAPVHRVDRAQRHALESMNRRPRRATTVMVAVILVAVFGVLAVLGSRHTGNGNHGGTSATSSVSATSSSTPAATQHHGHHTGHGHSTSTTSTTPPTQIVALSSTPLTAIYPVATDSYTVKVSASTEPCWVLATATATGSTLWTGTIQAGGSQVVDATGIITVELGAPSGSLSLDNVPVAFPSPVHTPFVATFQPTTSPSTTTPATTATTTTPTTAAATTSTTAAAG